MNVAQRKGRRQNPGMCITRGLIRRQAATSSKVPTNTAMARKADGGRSDAGSPDHMLCPAGEPIEAQIPNRSASPKGATLAKRRRSSTSSASRQPVLMGVLASNCLQSSYINPNKRPPCTMADHKDYEVSVFRPISMGNEAATAALVENVPDMNALLAAKLLSEATPENSSLIYCGSAHEAGLVAGRLEAIGFTVKHARFRYASPAQKQSRHLIELS